MAILKMEFVHQEGAIPIQQGEEIMIMLKSCHIRDVEPIHRAHEAFLDYFKDLGHDLKEIFYEKEKVRINLSFQFGTAGKTINSIPVGAFSDVEDNTDLPIPDEGVVILPRTKMEDYFSLIVNMTSTSMIMTHFDNIAKIIQSTGRIVQTVPVYGSTASSAIGALGEAMNIAALLYSDHSIIHKEKNYVVDWKNFPTKKDIGELQEGILTINEMINQNEPSNVVLEIMKTKSLPQDSPTTSSPT